MNRGAQLSWLISVLGIGVTFILRFIYGGWDTFYWIPLGVGLAAFVAAIVLDRKLFFEFLTARTSKNGLNMGMVILLALVVIVSINVLGVQFNKTADFTKEKLNSLADQTLTLLGKLDKDVEIKVFYRGEKDREQKAQVKNALSLYEEASGKVKLRFVDAYVRAAEAQQYLKRGDGFTVFAEYDGQRVRIDEPYNEEKITTAILKATKKEKKKIYFLAGHGEREPDSAEPTGMKDFFTALENSSYEVGTVNLLEGTEIPADAAVLAIIGPAAPLIEGEVAKIKAFAEKGGRLMIAADPDTNQNISQLTSALGVDFKKNYVITTRTMAGLGPTDPLGFSYDGQHEITKKFRSGAMLTVFVLASEVKPNASLPSGWTSAELVKTPEGTFTVAEIKPSLRPENMRQVTLAVATEGQLGDAAAGAKKFAAVVFGDSDWLSNRALGAGFNRDLGVNTIAFLAQDTDQISISPKQPEGTKLQITEATQRIVILAGGMLPLVFFVLGGVSWHRRRGA